jgi:hypothetical protein
MADKLSGKKMLNLDTEEWGCLYIGWAGGIDYEFTKTISMQKSSLGANFINWWWLVSWVTSQELIFMSQEVMR